MLKVRELIAQLEAIAAPDAHVVFRLGLCTDLPVVGLLELENCGDLVALTSHPARPNPANDLKDLAHADR